MTRKKKATDATKKTSELDFHFENIKFILLYSNATPIRSRIGSKYACGYCTNQYSTPAELKDHTLYTHVTDKPECLRISSLSKYVVYLDVTDLECLMCDARLKKLEDLMHHLKNYHDEPFHMDIKNHIIPFDFATSKMQCVDCCKQFDVFEDLQEHMNCHYKNYSCELCDDTWFVNRSLMMDHKKTVHFL
ncbi:unnamed protein product [Parnassius mnemosyne]|uniref:C2H2-type domain-containing protein n=1 Tax=Parnassius mnemosyne TaxID=213953 RepID=A0AAV1KYG0_9NEOP